MLRTHIEILSEVVEFQVCNDIKPGINLCPIEAAKSQQLLHTSNWSPVSPTWDGTSKSTLQHHTILLRLNSYKSRSE